MFKTLICYSQYILPQHGISWLMGKLANAKTNWFKNWFINAFSKHYQISLDEALIQDPHQFANFNDFFTRELKPGLRPVASGSKIIVSPADGMLAACGSIKEQQLIQAKNMYFDLQSLLGGDERSAALFYNGHYATIYLAPHNYHRVHMPFSGTLCKAIYIPGRLFSVNRMTSQLIPNLYARNERLVLIFETELGPAAVILVGALIVGSMQTVWMNKPYRGQTIKDVTPDEPIHLEKGAEVGRFLLGSTVLVLLPPGQLAWSTNPDTGVELRCGNNLATLTFH
jgi:phosphatidylserine decarboxylase